MSNETKGPERFPRDRDHTQEGRGQSFEGQARTPRIPASLTKWSLVGLGAGLLLGVLGNLGWAPWIGELAGWMNPIGRLWINALQLIVLPLIVTQVLAAIVGGASGRSIASLGGRVLLLFLVLQAGFGVASMAVSYAVVSPLDVSEETATALRGQLSASAGGRVEAPAASGEATGSGAAATPGGAAASGEAPTSFIDVLVPTNLFRAIADGQFLPVILFAVVFALGVTRLPEKEFNLLAGVFRALAGAMMNVMVWVLYGTPLAVFAIILGLGVETGWGAAGILGAYVVGVSGVLLLMTGALYPIAILLGRTSLGAFQRSLSAAQMVAISTRSSIASLPALIEGGEEHLDLPRSVTGFALPLAASVFKITAMVSGVFLGVFISHVFGISLTLGQKAYFLLFQILLSVTIVGVPRGGSGFNTLPAYTGVGLPVEGVVIAVVARTIPDIFMTLMNTTAYMTVGVLLSRGDRAPRSRAGRGRG